MKRKIDQKQQQCSKAHMPEKPQDAYNKVEKVSNQHKDKQESQGDPNP
jgi:hypothetical protein